MASILDYFGGGGGFAPTGNTPNLGAGIGGGPGIDPTVLTALGLGIMSGTREDPMGPAMRAYTAASQAAATNALRRQTLAEQRANRAQQQSNWERQFGEQQRQFNVGRTAPPSVVWQKSTNPDTGEEIHTPFLVNPRAGTPVQQITPGQALQFGSVPPAPTATESDTVGDQSAISIPGQQAAGAGVPNLTASQESEIPASAQYVQNVSPGAPGVTGGVPTPPAGTWMKQYKESYSKKLGEDTAKQQAKQEAKRQAGEQDVTSPGVMEDIDRSINLAKKEGKWVTGLGGQVLSNVGGTQAHDLYQLLQGIKANIGFDTLNKLRSESPTGGALGQVSNMEERLLQSVMGSVEQSQTPEQFIYNLNRLKKVYYETIHGKGTYPGDQAPPAAGGAGGGGAGPSREDYRQELIRRGVLNANSL